MCLACGEPDPPRVTLVNLAEALPDARVLHPIGSLDIGTPRARAALRDGWSFDEQTPDGEAFAWGVGSFSSLELVVALPRDVEVMMRGRPFVSPEAPVQTVAFEVNGQAVGQRELPADGAELRVGVPAAMLEKGSNELVLRYGYAGRPADWFEAEDRRDLAVAWSSLTLWTAEAPDDSAVRNVEDRLYLDPGIRLEYHVQLPRAASFVMDKLSRPRDRGVEEGLVVEVARDGESAAVEMLSPSQESRTVPLAQQEGIVRLALRVAGSPDDRNGKLVLENPRIEAPPEIAESPRWAADAPAAAETDPATPDIVIYLVDTLRADRLGCYGYELPVSPHVDAFAESAVLFENAVAQSPWTRPSVASLLTGLLPTTHGVEGRRHKLADESVSLAEVLGAAGYESAAFVTNPNVAGRFGLRQGFDTYRLLGKHKSKARHLNREVEKWLESRRGSSSPFFLYLHTVEPHGPYAPPKAFRDRFAEEVHDPALSSREMMRKLARGTIEGTAEIARQLSALYDAEVAANDAAFGALLDVLRRYDAYDDTVIVFVSDHGEEFLEHGRWEHAKSLYTEVLDVPLIMRFPGIAGRREAMPAQHADVLPTLLAFVGLETPAGVEGRDLLAGPGQAPAGRPVISSVDQGNFKGRSATTDRFRLIIPGSPAFGSGPELYDRSADPAERRNLASALPVTAQYLRSALDRLAGNGRAAPEVDASELDPEIVERLRALGYVE